MLIRKLSMQKKSQFLQPKLRLGVAAVTLVFGGCATYPTSNHLNERHIASADEPISVVSREEDDSLVAATERAHQLHAKMRELEIRVLQGKQKPTQIKDRKVNQSAVNMALDKKSKKSSKDQSKTLTAQAQVTQDKLPLEKQVNITVEFASGSALLDEKNRSLITEDIQTGLGLVPVAKATSKTQVRYIVRLTTFEKAGLDPLARNRLRAIIETLKQQGVPAESVTLKIRRTSKTTVVNDDSNQLKFRGGSRVVRITKVFSQPISS